MRRDGLVHVGVAALLAAAVVSVVGLVQSAGAASSGTSSVYVPIEPCRLADTRSGTDHVGSRATPIGTAESVTFQVTGTNGNCTIPSTATGIASNVTAVNPTAASYLTVYPADANPRPVASNLNYNAGSPPTPNQVTVGLSAGGAIAAFNNGGTVDVIIDIVGYYTAASSGGGGAPGPTCPAGGCVANYLGHDAVTSVGSMPSPVVDIGGCFHVPSSGDAQVSLNLPNGAKPIGASIVFFDNGSGFASLKLVSIDNATGAKTTRSFAASTVDKSIRATYDVGVFPTAPPQSASVSYFLTIETMGDNQIFCAAQVKYTF